HQCTSRWRRFCWKSPLLDGNVLHLDKALCCWQWNNPYKIHASPLHSFLNRSRTVCFPLHLHCTSDQSAQRKFHLVIASSADAELNDQPEYPCSHRAPRS